ncbi:hypothetical protein F0562_026021 [Nyssa sinensis]|uniref:Uncharacterized protein n=1 Tax=Nyssa sinensis TaxID=561372 RepID=A0A5J5B9N4_9ASTE|nr:hypothetical protein F0562_026021 [Nyssa sinensis]
MKVELARRAGGYPVVGGLGDRVCGGTVVGVVRWMRVSALGVDDGGAVGSGCDGGAAVELLGVRLVVSRCGLGFGGGVAVGDDGVVVAAATGDDGRCAMVEAGAVGDGVGGVAGVGCDGIADGGAADLMVVVRGGGDGGACWDEREIDGCGDGSDEVAGGAGWSGRRWVDRERRRL